LIWVSGPDKRCTFFNKGWLTFTGRAMEPEPGNGWAEGVHPDDQERCLGAYNSSFQARQCFEMEYRLLRTDGEYRWVLHKGSPRFGLGGEFAGYIGSAIDITDFKRAQDEALSRQKLDSLTVLTRGIAHDFNNLMSAILAEAELAEADQAEGLSPAEQIQRIQATATRAAEIVQQLMTYSNQKQSNLEFVDLAGVVQGLLDLLKASISKHVDLLVDVRKPLPRVMCNRSQISQLVMNLVINASQAIGDKEGVIKVCLSPASEMQEATLQGGGSQAEFVRIEVSDTGCGITEADQAKIFDPFFTTKPRGHGLGLAVVQGIVHSLRGTIRVGSRRERGTTFEVFLPCDQAGTEAASSTDFGAPAEDIRLIPKTVLFVEDEVDLRFAIAKALRGRGFSVFTADEGPAAVEAFRAHAEEIEVVLLDSNLPGCSGREVLRWIRAIKPGVRVILSSAYPPELAVSATSGEPPSGFLQKPYTLAELMRALQDPGSKTSQAKAAFQG
jgi:PAS domain S-box-containing protein